MQTQCRHNANKCKEVRKYSWGKQFLNGTPQENTNENTNEKSSIRIQIQIQTQCK